MTWLTQNNILNSLQILAILAGLFRYTMLDKASRFFLLLLLISYFAERLGSYTALKYHNNSATLNTFAIIDYSITCLYFSKIIPGLNNKIAFRLIAGGIIIWIITSLLFSFKTVLNTPFMVFETISIIALCHYYFYHFLKSDHELTISPAFLFVSLLFIFWSFTFAYWLFGITLSKNLLGKADWLNALTVIINVICYTGFSLIFLFYRKLQRL